MKIEVCCKCKTEFAMSDDLYRIAIERRDAFTFYCPNGHPQVYLIGESELDKVRRERDQLKQSIAYEQDRVSNAKKALKLAERRVSAANGQITKMKNRAANGVCPCCNRHFTNLERHMMSMHPHFIAEPNATETAN